MKLVGKFLCLNLAVGLTACGGNNSGYSQSTTKGQRGGTNSTAAVSGNGSGTNAAGLREGSNFAPPDAQNWGWHPGDWGRDISNAGRRLGRSVSDLGRDIGGAVAGLDPVEAVKRASQSAAAEYHSSHNDGNFEDCALFVIGVLAAAGSYGGPWAAAAGGAAGAAGARLACRAWYP